MSMVQTVQLFITCIIDTLYPEIGEAVVQVLERIGMQVEFPAGQTCCGQPAFNAGMRKQALPIARHTIEVFEPTQGPIEILQLSAKVQGTPGSGIQCPEFYGWPEDPIPSHGELRS